MVTAAAARRELEDLRAAINHHRREGLCSEIVSVVLPPQTVARERWLTRSEAARLLWAAWRAKQVMRDQDTRRAVGRHVARFILVGLYTGTRSSAICGAALMPTIGRGHVDLERGVFYRRADRPAANQEAAAAGKAPAAAAGPYAPLGAARARAKDRWSSGTASRSRACARASQAAVRAAGLGAEVTPHILRHTCATWLMQKGVNLWDAAGFLGMTVQQLEQGYGHHHPGLSGGSRRSVRGPVGARNPVNKTRRTARERDENRRYFKGRTVIHHVRDVGVAGSNPATPTRYSGPSLIFHNISRVFPLRPRSLGLPRRVRHVRPLRFPS